MFEHLKLICWKIYIIRKRHLILTIAETIVPILLFLLIAYARCKISGVNKVEVTEPSYKDVVTSDLLNQDFPVGISKLFYSPKNNFTDSIMREVQLKLSIASDDIQSFVTEEKLLAAHAKSNQDQILAVTFNGNNAKDLDYNIRIYEKYRTWNTDSLFSTLGGSEQYRYRGFLTLQLAIDSSFIELTKQLEKLPFTLAIQEFPYPPHTVDNGLTDMFMHFLPLITIFSFIFLCPGLIKRVAEERFTGIKEFMKMVGMKPWVLWFGWFLHALSTNIISIVFIVFLMKTALWGASYPPIEFCDGSVLFVFLFLYCAAAIAFCFFISMLFQKPTIAMVFGILVWILSYVIPKAIVTQYQNLSWGKKILFGLFPNMALNYGYQAISLYEKREVGVHWGNLAKSGSGGVDDVTMLNVLLMFLLDIVIFVVLTFYVENINPGEYGIAKTPYYPITNVWQLIKNYVCKTSTQVEHEAQCLNNVEEGRGQTVGIEIKKLYKKFGPIVAVDGLSMSIYENQITVLLGHNGAGKTTTMSMITGMTNSSGGSIKIQGHNIKNNIDKVRKSMGLCPQHNLFFPDFTVMEHLIFFSMLKGTSYVEAKKEVINVLQKLNIYQKKDEKPTKLSGGMKRKLCLGMAIVGGSKVLILDEPTSGMDPESRREVWNLLLEWRKTKTILITTHFMEEADVLGDWIAIMANGTLQCYGTPMFLKKKYATGYHLSLMLENFDNRKQINDLITTTIKDAEMLRENANNLVYMLPLEEKPKFSTLFRNLDDNMENFNINNISITVTTLEEVFLKAKSENNNVVSTFDNDLNTLKRQAHSQSKTNAHPFIPKFQSLFYKRFYFMLRKYPLYIPAIVITLLLTILTIHLGQGSSDYYGGTEKELPLKLGLYGETAVYYGGTPIKNDTLQQVKTKYGDLVGGQALAREVSDVSNAIIEKGVENIAFYLQHMIVAAEFNETDEGLIINAMYSASAAHGSPISLNLITNAIAKALLGDEYSIRTSNKPLVALNGDYESPNEQSEVQVGILWLILVPIGLLFLLGNFIIFPVSEISTKFTHLQIMCGISPTVYWFSNFLFDYGFYILVIVFKLIVISIVTRLAYENTPFGLAEIAVLARIWLAYGHVGIPFSYIFSHKKTVTGAFAVLLMVGIFLSIVPTVVIGVLEMSGQKYYENIGDVLKNVCLFLCPNFAITYISVKFARKAVRNYNWLIMPAEKKKVICYIEENVNPCCKGDTLECANYKDYFSSDNLGIGLDVAKMQFGFFLYMAIIIFWHSYSYKWIKERFFEFLRKLRGLPQREEKKTQIIQKTSSLSAHDVQKYYMFKKVVDNVSFNVNYGECYGLLGVNGAGKTTTFRTLTRDLVLMRGNVVIQDKDMKEKIPIAQDKYMQRIGYCPQYDALNFTLTGKELLKVFAVLRGYRRAEADNVADVFIDIFDLKQYAEKPCSSYSGGNKRKLSLALAFIGFPQNVLLDEPTNGVDPASRRSFWNTLSKIQKNEKVACILSSHSMEECEALCHRIGIMKDGTIRAEDSLPNLKKQFQNGFNVVFKLKPNVRQHNQISVSVTDVDETQRNDDVDVVDGGVDAVDGLVPSSESQRPQNSVAELKRNFKNYFSDAKLKDEHSGILYYHIDDKNKRLSNLFEIIEKIKSDFEDIIEDYSISETSLEDVFLTVAREKTK